MSRNNKDQGIGKWLGLRIRNKVQIWEIGDKSIFEQKQYQGQQGHG